MSLPIKNMILSKLPVIFSFVSENKMQTFEIQWRKHSIHYSNKLSSKLRKEAIKIKVGEILMSAKLLVMSQVKVPIADSNSRILIYMD